jgi:acylphosphatase
LTRAALRPIKRANSNREEKDMGLVIRRFPQTLIVALALMTAGGIASAAQEAITATIVGQAIQKVGFRAMIQKQAILYNLAGFARNNPDGTVSLSLQGDKHRIDKTIEAIRAGNGKSSTDNVVKQSAAAVDPNLKTFTVYAWTSTTRGITNPYDLVFTLRPDDSAISKKDAKAAWNAIAERTLKGDDLVKFKTHLDDED